MQSQITQRVVRALNDLDIPYLLTGSMALTFYGIPRLTRDADFVVQFIEGAGIKQLAEKLGPEFILDPQSSFETITSSRRYVFEVRQTDFKVEVFLLRDTEFDQHRFKSRQKMTLGDTWVYLPRVEHIVVKKLDWANTGRRTKDVGDIVLLLKCVTVPIDWTHVEEWADRMGTRPLLEQLREELAADLL